MTAALSWGLPPAALQSLLEVLAQYPEINSVTLFGSRAKGNWLPGSDIDLCLDAPGLSMARRLELENRLDDLLLPWRIDLLLRHEIENDALLAHVARIGIRLA